MGLSRLQDISRFLLTAHKTCCSRSCAFFYAFIGVMQTAPPFSVQSVGFAYDRSASISSDPVSQKRYASIYYTINAKKGQEFFIKSSEKMK